MTWLAVRLSLGSAVALGLARFAFGLVVPAMRDDLGWSLADAGLQTTANGIGYLAGAVVVAMVVRRLSTARSFQLGMVIATLSLAATATTPAYSLLMVLRATAGLAGQHTLGALTVLFAAGQTVGPWPAGFLADRLGAGAALGWTAVLCAAGALAAVSWKVGSLQTRESSV